MTAVNTVTVSGAMPAATVDVLEQRSPTSTSPRPVVAR